MSRKDEKDEKSREEVFLNGDRESGCAMQNFQNEAKHPWRRELLSQR